MDVPQNGQVLSLLPIVAMVITATIGYLAWRQRPARSVLTPVARPLQHHSSR
jgi:hypothetical protein